MLTFSLMAVKKITGMFLFSGFDLMISQASNPSIPGIITSKSIKSGRTLSTRSIALLPLTAMMILYFNSRSIKAIICTFFGLSSTTRTDQNIQWFLPSLHEVELQVPNLQVFLWPVKCQADVVLDHRQAGEDRLF